ncbi:hypothetical protein [Polynucleobacter acidiphobus]|uniref:hypothetical protein n=1 Tax=Polynucleobacter acidiphobus TaxID=556053 RepID=UPI001F17559C|nr:hypothetical protein [Polynucleobacter acidiphobus]
MPRSKFLNHLFFEILLSAALYIAFFYFNLFVLAPFEVAQGVSWIFLPAGLRIFIALIFDYSGAVGLAVASLIINFISFSEYDLISILGIAAICGVAPLLSRHFVIHNLRVHSDLSNISLSQLVAIIFVFSLLSSGLHQLWFEVRNLESGSFDHFLIMLFGDIVGSVLIITLIKYGINVVKKKMGRDSLIE